MKIVNKRKFIRTVSILVLLILGLIVFANRSYSGGEISYKESYIYSGDSLWSIAKEESSTNKYFENKDIRDIIIELKHINNLSGSTILSIGDKIIIPEYK